MTARSSQSRVEPGDPVRVFVTASPVDGQANQAVCELVARYLGVSKSRVWLLKGAKSRDKTLVVDGMGLQDLEAALRKLG
ncbi:MAG: DUF167 domain-containing protein [Fimbriimonadaceae bacterium]|nr:DUF167 domain-containing protein [Fimbriimonadaceae bacterium]QYK58615.1 MAG: DUF167 domain-containing protein [Fimbriimonadaceae bacterium]